MSSNKKHSLRNNILVTGAVGQLGRELQAFASGFPAMIFHFKDSTQLDICDEAAVHSLFEAVSFQWCINCAAYTAVDKAEAEPEAAFRVNAQGPLLLARTCREHGARLIHLSSDYVFHTHQNRPYREDDPTHPQGVYAGSKLAGEDAVRKEHPEGGMIVRTSWVYSPYGHNFVKTMLRLGAEREEVNVVCDQIGTSTYARDLASALLRMIADAASGAVPPERLRGVYHYSNEGAASWYDFALAIMELAQLPCKVNPIETEAYPTPAKRPPYSVLNKSKWKAAFGQVIPHWRESLGECLREMQAGGNAAG